MKKLPLLLSLLLVGCAALESPRSSSPGLASAPARPGLATGWGATSTSHLNTTTFVRASGSPAGTDTIYYNDKAGIDSMGATLRRVSPFQQAAGGLVEWGISSRGNMLATFKDYRSNRRFVTGSQGATYTLNVKNRHHSPLEIVASVDGLDVMDGRPASFAKRGYIVDPGKTLTIEGFRTSQNSIARFEFSSVADSYSARTGSDTRNIGVIGIAVFTPRADTRWAQPPPDSRQRTRADPFPGN
jgi:hypothetical protein